MLREIQVRGGVKKPPHPSGGGGGGRGVDFSWNNPITVNSVFFMQIMNCGKFTIT